LGKKTESKKSRETVPLSGATMLFLLVIFMGQFISLHLFLWIDIAHFLDFQVRSSLNRSQKKPWFTLIKVQILSA